MREEVINPKSNTPKIIRLFYLLRIKRMDAFNNASMGTDLGNGARFATPPILRHGLNGIVISHFAQIGKDCMIFQRATIAEGKGKTSAVIGDNCVIGAGAVVLGNVVVGNNVKIGSNCVVNINVPDNCTVVGNPARIVNKKESDVEYNIKQPEFVV